MKKINLELVNKLLYCQYDNFVINDKTVDLSGPGVQTRILICDLEEKIYQYYNPKKIK